MNNIQRNRVELGSLIRKAREEKHYSQDGLAKLVDMERQQIYRIENGKSGTSKETGLKIAKVLEIDERKILELIAGISDELNLISESQTIDVIEGVRVQLQGGKHFSKERQDEFIRSVTALAKGLLKEEESEK